MIGLALLALTVLAVLFGVGPADTQAPRPARIALLLPGSPPGAGGLPQFRTALRDLGYVEGQNLVLEVHWEQGRPERWPAVVQEILRGGVDVIVSGRGAATRAVLRATKTVPLVSPTLGDPVADGIAHSLARPGGNVTGLTLMEAEMHAKRVDLIKQAVPDLVRAALLWDSQHTPSPPRNLLASEAAAGQLGLTFERVPMRGIADLEPALARAKASRARALVFVQGALFAEHRARIADLALKHRLPTISGRPASPLPVGS